MPSIWKYLPADALQLDDLDVAALDVRSTHGALESLGSIEGFILDASTGHVRFVIIDSGAWFTGGSYLVPPSFARIDWKQRVLWLDTPRAALARFPKFDPLVVDQMSEVLPVPETASILDSFASTGRPPLRSSPAAPGSCPPPR
ncbi:MAG: PRC-barrel domain-containing protein [Vicinamibacterales bacterium]